MKRLLLIFGLISCWIPNASHGNISTKAIQAAASNDAGVSEITSLSTYCPGALPVEVEVSNYGDNQLDSVTIEWSVNGVAQTSYKYTGLLDTADGVGNSEVILTIGNYNFAANQVYDFKVWTASPNGTADVTNGNDTLSMTLSLPELENLAADSIKSTSVQISWDALPGNSYHLKYGEAGFDPSTEGTAITAQDSMPYTIESLTPAVLYEVYIAEDCGSGVYGSLGDPLSFTTLCTGPLAGGTYTVNPSASQSATNFASLASLAGILMECGISGAVTINIASGVYNEQIVLANISGLSSTNTLVMQADPSNTAPVEMTFDASSSSDNHLIGFHGVSYVTIRGMEFTATNAMFGRIFNFLNINQHLLFEENVFTGSYGIIGNAADRAILCNNGGPNNVEYCTIRQNEFYGGSYAVYWFGSNPLAPEMGNIVDSNIITDFSNTAIYSYFQKGLKVRGNKVKGAGTFTTEFGGYFFYSDELEITGNKIVINAVANNYGLYFAFSNGPSVVANNMISTHGNVAASYGINIDHHVKGMEIAYNSILLNSGVPAQGRSLYISNVNNANLRIINNNFVNNGGGVALEVTPPAVNSFSKLDHNNYYTSGTDLAKWNDTLATNLSDLQSAHSKDANSLNVDPQYTDTADLHYNNPALNGKGLITSNVTIDFDGENRSSSQPDIGADEKTFIQGDCTPFAALRLDSILDTSLVISWTPGVGNTGFKLEYDTLGFIPGTGTVISGTYPASEPPVYINGLVADTEYEVYLTEYCNSGADSSYNYPEAFRTLEPCPQPAEPVVLENKTDTSISFSFGSGLHVNSFEYEYGFRGYSQGTGTIVNGGNPITISDLNPATSYDFYVRSNCPGYGNLPWIGPFTFTTLCVETYMPYHENFSIWPPTCMDTTGGNDYWVHENNDHAAADFLSGAGNSIRHITTQPIIINNPARVRFSWSHAYYADERLEAQIEVNGSGNWQNLITLEGKYFDSEGSTDRFVGDFIEEIIYLDSSMVGDTVKLRFISDQQALGNAIFLDDIHLENIPDCPDPYRVQMDTLTSNSITVNIEGYGDGNYEYEYGSSGYTPGSGISGSGGSQFTVSGLNSRTSYDLFVRTDCSSNSKGVSGWTGPLSFTTSCSNNLNGTYTIDPTLTGSSNFTSISDAVNSLNLCGVSGPVIFNIKEGQYNEQVDISGHPQLQTIVGASAANTIIFQADPSNTNKVEVYYEASTDVGNFVVNLKHASHITFKDIEFRATGEVYARVIEMSGGDNNYINFEGNVLITDTAISSSDRISGIYAHDPEIPNNHITIRNNVITGGYTSIYFNGTDEFKAGTDLLIERNELRKWYYSSAYLGYADQMRYTHNEVYSVGRCQYPVRLFSCKNSEISYNHLDINGSSTVNTLHIYGSDGTDIIGNIIKTASPGTNYGLNYSGIKNRFSDRGLVANNMFTVYGGSSTYGMYFSSTDSADIVYNSVNIRGGNNTRAVEFDNTGKDVKFLNNNMVNSVGGYAIYADEEIDIDDLTDLNYNNYYTTGNNIGYYNGAEANLTNWQSATGRDANSVSGDPVFVASDDLHVLFDILNEAGTPFPAVTTDIDGDVRSATSPDIGADEYTPASGDLSLLKGEFWKDNPCLGNSDTIALYVQNIIGDTVNFSEDTLTAHYTVTGPVNSSGVITVNSGTLNPSDTVLLFAYNIDMSIPGTYTLKAYIDSNIVNIAGGNDTLDAAATIEIDTILTVSPRNYTLEEMSDSVLISAYSPFFNGTGTQSGLNWTLNGNSIDDAARIYGGPYTSPGEYKYIATYASPCGITYRDSATITVRGCELPGNLASSDLSPDSASLSWTSSAGNWIIIFGPSGFDPATGGNTVNTTNNPLRIGGLTVSIAYDFYVVADCGGADGLSDTAGPHTFTTPAVDCDDAGADNSITVCDTISDINLGDYLSGADAGGSWIDANNTGSLTGNIFDATNVSFDMTYNFYYVIAGTTECPADTATISVTVDSCDVGIMENILDQSLTLYPNPVTSDVYIEFITGGSEDAVISIMDLSGKVIMEREARDINGKYQDKISLEHLSKGIYLLKIETGSHTSLKAIRQIVKQ